MRTIRDVIQESLDVKRCLIADDVALRQVEKAVHIMIECFRGGGKTLFCGNGGSAADAQHFAAELSGRFLFDRDPLPTEVLHGNSSFVTAVANDYDYESVFARAVRASGRPGDVLVALSTSGQSPTIIRAAEMARSLGMSVIAMTGSRGGPLADVASVWLAMPSTVTGRIQEAHVAVIHAIAEQVEAALFEAPLR